MTTLVHALRDGNKRYGLQTMCESGGMAGQKLTPCQCNRAYHRAAPLGECRTGLLFWAYAIAGGHLRRDLLPTKTDLAHLPYELVNHLRLKFPKGEDAMRYSAPQNGNGSPTSCPT
jgi:thiosulfate reductase cytochrome b subunit